MTRKNDEPVKLMRERLQKSSDKQPLTARCALCPDWESVGTARETREAARAHREALHPETFRTTKRPARSIISRNFSREQEEEINEARRQRIRALGLDIEP